MTNFRCIALATLFLIGIPALSGARTWRVERDGTGEFATIHNAMIACSAGDTILIGPGRYDDFHPFTAPAWTSEAIVEVSKDNLTFIGSGSLATIIGPEQMYLPPGVYPAPVGIGSAENVTAKFVDMTIENADSGIYWAHGRLIVESCRVLECRSGLALWPESGVNVVDSEFQSEVPQAYLISAHSSTGLLEISRCSFSSQSANRTGIGLNGVQSALISECAFDISGGISLNGSVARIESCNTTSRVELPVFASNASSVEIHNNYLSGSLCSLYIQNWSSVSGSSNVLAGGDVFGAIFVTAQSTANLNGNHILKTGEYAVVVGQYVYDVQHLDFTGNYWGTTDQDSIASWIWDYNDDPNTRAYIDFLPLADGPVSVESTIWGDLKASFK